MRQFFKKLLTVLIALQLGLSPLQGAIAGFSGSFDQLGDSYQMGDAFDSSMAVSSDYALDQICGQHNVDDKCFDYICFSGQCAACALALSKLITYPPYLVATPGMSLAYEGIVGLAPTPLFRPPKI